MVRPRMLMVLFCLLLLTPLAGAGDDEIDIRKVSPAEMGSANVTDLLRDAHLAYQAKEYEQAARLYIRALRGKAGDAGALYNLACCYGLLTLPEQAAGFLEAAWNAGFRDIGHIGYDPDFVTVREHPAFAAVMEKLRADAARREREGGRRLPVECRVLGDVRVIEPEGMVRGRRYPLVVGLHGYGSNGERFARLFAGKDLQTPFLYCVPQAPYAFPSGNELAMSWGFGGPGLRDAAGIRSGRLAEDYVLAVVAAVKREYLVDERRVFVLGFSQGAEMAFRIGMRNPGVFAAAIPIGGWCVPGDCTAEEIRGAAEGSRFFVCHSPGDRMVTYDACERAKAFFTDHGIAHQVIDYTGGHSIPKDLAERIITFVANPVLGPDETLRPPSGPEKVLLRYRFPSERSLRYVTTSETSSEFGDIELHQTFESHSTWRECGRVDDDALVAITYESCRMHLKSPQSGTIAYDSESPPDPDHALHLTQVVAGALPGTTVFLTVSSRGEMKSVSGFGDFYERLVKKDKRADKLEEQFDDKARLVALQANAPELPEDEVAVGDRWKRSRRVSLSTLGPIDFDVDYELVELTGPEGARTALITGQSTLGAMEFKAGRLVKGSISVRMVLNVDTGAIVSSETTSDAELDLDGASVVTGTRTRVKLAE